MNKYCFQTLNNVAIFEAENDETAIGEAYDLLDDHEFVYYEDDMAAVAVLNSGSEKTHTVATFELAGGFWELTKYDKHCCFSISGQEKLVKC